MQPNYYVLDAKEYKSFGFHPLPVCLPRKVLKILDDIVGLSTELSAGLFPRANLFVLAIDWLFPIMSFKLLKLISSSTTSTGDRTKYARTQ
jgi:hypothetical protein